MVSFAALMSWAYPATEYEEDGKPMTSIWRPLWDSYVLHNLDYRVTDRPLNEYRINYCIWFRSFSTHKRVLTSYSRLCPGNHSLFDFLRRLLQGKAISTWAWPSCQARIHAVEKCFGFEAIVTRKLDLNFPVDSRYTDFPLVGRRRTHVLV